MGDLFVFSAGHGWDDAHVWTHVLVDLFIWLAFAAVALALAFVLWKRPAMKHRSLYCLLMGLILLSGVTHLLEALSYWWPGYQILVVMKVLAGLAFLIVVMVGMTRVLPQIAGSSAKGALPKEAVLGLDVEEQLARANLFRTAMRHAPIGQAIVGLDGAWISVNEKLCEVFGYREDELLQKDFQQLTHPDDLDADLALLERTLAGEIDEYSMEKRYFNRAGEIVYALLSVVLIRRDDKPQYFISQIVDITPQRELLMQQDSLIRELEQKSNELQQIIYVVSHDLRSPLVNIIGFSTELEATLKELDQRLCDSNPAQWAVNGIWGDDLPEMLHFIHESARRMDRLLKGLLQYSRLGRYEITAQHLDMNRLMGDLVEDFAFQLKEVDARITLGELDNCCGDLTLVTQLFGNLIDNAIKYRSTERPLEIRVSSEVVGSRIRYVVADNGLGIKPKFQEKVFEVFHRLHPDLTEGDGLGLSICYLVARRMRGDIMIDPEPDVGAKFYVELPLDLQTYAKPQLLINSMSLAQPLHSANE